MASHLELRVPFVDRGVAAASLRVDDSLKMQGGGKAVLIEAVRDLLPREVWDRPKQGFALPFSGWMRGVLKAEVGSALCSEQRVARVGISPSTARRVWQRFLADQGVTWSRPWAIYTLVRWAEQCGAELTDAVVARDMGTHALAS
jgi:asparagine synthase (glutamine-hydrolysing)